MMPTLTIVAALAALLAALVALYIYHAVAMRPALRRLSELTATHDQLIGGGAGASARLQALEGEIAAQRSALQGVTERTGELEALARTDLSRVGFVRYDAYDDTGSELSYALALLNRDGDGVVISSIYSRSDTRTYGKAVTKFSPAVPASDEELRAIEFARSKKA
ncbi:MAG: DUF4446 family protein [bacterium]|nr:DUF4446 family protein [bacterium]